MAIRAAEATAGGGADQVQAGKARTLVLWRGRAYEIRRSRCRGCLNEGGVALTIRVVVQAFRPDSRRGT